MEEPDRPAIPARQHTKSLIPTNSESPTKADRWIEDEAAPAETPSQNVPVPEAPLTHEVMDDVAICTAYGDVLTIVENADLGLREGRMEAQERDGWYQLATRVLDRLPSNGGGAVSQAIADLQEVAPAIPSGSGEDPAGVRSPEWYDAQEALSAACDDLGVPLAINVFTGG